MKKMTTHALWYCRLAGAKVENQNANQQQQQQQQQQLNQNWSQEAINTLAKEENRQRTS